ncbi:hypothetical protein E6W99_08580 [Metabacillus sediminilitoris]|uniref:Uncharacterized protein n=1 Tax=Metabacillus sediminilitoris TaxID=2567941 RepID=A0A4S4BYV5_9BACI|nr:hypothetical protein E6W99_08580 [Metabacillus sediminilitoris]
MFLKRKNLRLIEAEVRDSCGSSGAGETHAGVYAEEAQRPPRGKRASLAAINHTDYLINSNKVCENSQIKRERKRGHRRKQETTRQCPVISCL